MGPINLEYLKAWIELYRIKGNVMCLFIYPFMIKKNSILNRQTK